eukprot:2966451-Heterocapsa_arctica.AAC.1
MALPQGPPCAGRPDPGPARPVVCLRLARLGWTNQAMQVFLPANSAAEALSMLRTQGVFVDAQAVPVAVQM